MAKTKAKVSTKRARPAIDPEIRESQLIASAVDLAEKQLREGTASSQIITHYLKLATSKHQLELEKLRLENDLTREKTNDIKDNRNMESLYEEAISAFKSYHGGLSD